MKKILFGFVMCATLGGSLLVSAHEGQDKLATQKAEQQATWITTICAELKDVAEGLSYYPFACLGAILGTGMILEKDIQGRRAIWVPIAAASWFRLYQGWQKMNSFSNPVASNTVGHALNAQQNSEKHFSVQDKLAAQPICTHCIGLSACQPSPQTAKHESCAQSRQAISDMMTD